MQKPLCKRPMAACHGDVFMRGSASIESRSPVLQEITNSDWVAKTFGLRFEVWNQETKLRPHILQQRLISDPHDEHARHWAVFCGNELVAAARMCVHHDQADTPDAPAFCQFRLPQPVATLNRLVVHLSARNIGLGSRLCQCRVEAAKVDGARCVVGTFTDARVASLERLGLRLTGQRWIPNHAESLVANAMVLEF
jgi:GNAT superfamily N-acetyltransferase